VVYDLLASPRKVTRPIHEAVTHPDRVPTPDVVAPH
jgi:hypothetical protein